MTATAAASALPGGRGCVTNAGAVSVRVCRVVLVAVVVVLVVGLVLVVGVVMVVVVRVAPAVVDWLATAPPLGGDGELAVVVLVVDGAVAAAVVVRVRLTRRVVVRVVVAVVVDVGLVADATARALPLAESTVRALVELVVAPEPPHALSASATAAPSRTPAAVCGLVIQACNACRSQSTRATDMVRGDGSESDGP
jgi:hypothetical protein